MRPGGAWELLPFSLKVEVWPLPSAVQPATQRAFGVPPSPGPGSGCFSSHLSALEELFLWGLGWGAASSIVRSKPV